MSRRCCFMFALTAACLAAGPASSPPNLSALATEGQKLTDDSANWIAAKVERDALDDTVDTTENRARLLGYYLSRRVADHDARVKQIFWMIAHRPADPLTASPWCGIDADDNDAVKKATDTWEAVLKKNAADPVIDGNAAAFFASHDTDRAAELLKAAIDTDNKNWVWRVRLADLDDRIAADHPADAAKLCRDALQLRVGAYSLKETTPAQRFTILIKEPADALRAGDVIQAKQLANQLLETAKLFKSDPGYGQAIHVGHIVLGQIAASAGKLEAADEELAAAGHAPISPQITADGPDLALAQDLFNRGEKTAVREYLDACTKLWPAGDHRLRGWIADIDDGKTPAFRK